MREGWTYKKLVDECAILYGYPFDSKNFSSSNEDMPLVRIRDVKEGATSTYYKGEYPKEYIIHKGDFLIGMDGEFNISPWQSDDALLNQRVCKIASKSSDVLMRYVYRFLVKELKKIEDETPFVTVKHLSAKKLNQIKLPIPPLSEQERIVSELDLLSSIIEKKKAQLKEYDQLAQSIFYDMFGDPIENPKGWELKKLGEVCEYAKTRINSNDISIENYIGVENLLQKCQGRVLATKVPEDLGLTEYIEGDVLIGNIRPYLKKIWLADCRGGCNGDVLTIRRKKQHEKDVDTIYLFKCLSTNLFFDFAMQYAKGEKMPRGDKKEIMKYPISLPPLSLQQSFAEKIGAIEKAKKLIRKTMVGTRILFNYTMDKYFG